jgi:3-oxoacyl-[acyl-carrier protein] reductase
MQDRVAVVIGGTKGIGRSVSRHLAAAGARVGIVSRDEATAKALIEEIASDGGAAQWFGGDFMVASEMLSVADKVKASLGNCSILVAGGGPGYPRPMPFMETAFEDYDSFFLSRCIGRLYAVRAFAPQMIEEGYGKVVLITTDAGRVPTRSEVLNGAAAAALVFATRALAQELTSLGIRVNAVSTTLTSDTPSFERFQQKVAAGSPDAIAKIFSKIQSKTPLGSLNTPEDVARSVLFLAGPDSDRISGAILSVNGGLSTP